MTIGDIWMASIATVLTFAVVALVIAVIIAIIRGSL